MIKNNFIKYFPYLFLGLVFLTVLFSLSPASGQTRQADPLGTVNAQEVGCPSGGLAGAACYALEVSCPEIPNYTVYLKTLAPSGPPKGVVTLTRGGTSTELFEDYVYGSVTIQNLLKSHFLVAEMTFGAPFTNAEQGWQTNVNGIGPRAASCRYATATQWIKNNLAAQVPLCAAGLSAASQQIAEGLAHYGLGQYLAFAELGSGPPFSRADQGCIRSSARSQEYCSGVNIGMNVGLTNAHDYIDPAYVGPWCSQATETGSTEHQAEFLADSVTSPDAVLNYPNTTVWFLYGSLDNSSAINQGENYRQNISSSNHAGCVRNTPHALADTLAGAQQMASDLSLQCIAKGH
jgi:hypothetical protein